MAVTPHMYGKLFNSIGSNVANITATHPIKILLGTAYTTPNYTANAGAITVADAVTAGFAEVATAGGYTQGNQAATYTGGTVRWAATAAQVYTLDLDDVVWATSTITASHALFCIEASAANASRYLIAHWDLGGSQISSSGDFKLTINVSGLVTFTGPG